MNVHDHSRGAFLHGDAEALRLGIFLTPNLPLAPLALVLEAMRIANSIDGSETFSPVLVSADGCPVRSSCGLQFAAQHSIADPIDYHVLIVCAGADIVLTEDRKVLSWLRRLYSHGVRLGAISSGAFVLAQAGLLDGLSCSVHWETARALGEKFPHVQVNNDIFCTDSRIVTCAGGMSTLDLMLHLIEEFKGRHFARVVADKLIYPSIRMGRAPARIDLNIRTGINSPLLLRAITLMERTLAEPMKISAISKKLGTTSRQLERLFLRSFNATPSSYYMVLRLNEAKNLLLHSDIPITEVAFGCGFQSSSHFTKRYRDIFKIAPSMQRRQRDLRN